MAPTDIDPKYSRQVILSSVGPEGQKKWSQASVLLVGEGSALQAAATGLASAGVSRLLVLSAGHFDTFPLTDQFHGLHVDLLPEEYEQLPAASQVLVVTENKELRHKVSRWMRHHARPILFAWPAGSGFALFSAPHQGGQCPCLECFEIMNPKAFTHGEPSIQRTMGAMAASETLQRILKEDSPLDGKVWITSLGSGVSFHHEVKSTYKCPARLLEEGAVVTP